ncbi:MAG: glycosyltransferase [Kineosporiaceae bacterium]|jgi:glycosyltransferase involved in cell wall biosynthesis
MSTLLVRPRTTRQAPDLSVLSSGHDVADARLHREVALATARGLDVEVLGLGAATDGPGGARVRTWARPGGIARRLAHATALPWRARGRVLLVLDPELVVPALLRARLTGRRIVVDVHEDYAKLLRDRPWAGGLVGRVVRAGVGVVVRSARRADLVVVADEHVPPRRVPPARDGRARRIVVPNLPVPDDLPEPSDPAVRPRLVYVGDVRSSRGLRSMLTAVEAAPGWCLDVVGPVAPADAAHVAHWRRTSTASGRVRWRGRRPPVRAWADVADAWAGLCLLEDTPAFRDALPSKVYEYLCSGLPVLVSPRPRMVELVARSGAGVVVADADEAAAVLRRWAEHPDEPQRLRAAARRFAATLGDGSAGYADLAGQVEALVRTAR